VPNSKICYLVQPYCT